MDFRRKLDLLGPPKAAENTGDRATVLEELRRKMGEILERDFGSPRPPADPSLTLLPFAREHGEAGVVYRRYHALARSHHVGRIPVDAAASSRPELLAMLALDPSLARCDPTRALFLDTETTGLGGGAGVVAFLVGLAFFDAERRLCIEQFLLRSPADEPAMLSALAERLGAADCWVSFNGKTFDLPLLSSRFVMNRLSPPAPRPHLDLLHVARRLHRDRVKKCRLVTLESEVLGFERGPDIDGGDIAARYGHFLRTGDEEALRAVVEHNFWDVITMAALVGLYGEPFDLLAGEDLVGLARTLKRARALDEAARAATVALERGASASALRVRGEIHKARGDRAKALLDFEELCAEVDDPAARLELAKLYEHHVKEPLRALEIARQGTGEPEAAALRRTRRLEAKAQRRRD